jgi:hypothetical protein
MNKSEKEILPLRVGVNAKAAGTMLTAVALGGPIGLAVFAAGAAMVYTGNKWLNSEVERMESERAAGKTPVRPKPVR